MFLLYEKKPYNPFFILSLIYVFNLFEGNYL